MLAELHLHMYGCIRSRDLLRHLAGRGREPRWELYEEAMWAAYGDIPPAREVVQRYRNGDPDAVREFEDLFVFGDADAGSFHRFSAKYCLLSAGLVRNDPQALVVEVAAETASLASMIRADHVRQGVSYAEQRQLFGANLESPRNRAVLDTLLETFDDGDAGIVERLAVSLDRSNPWPAWEIVQQAARGPRGSALTAVDFCNVEEGHPPKEAAAIVEAIREFNARYPDRALAILYHVGESFGDKSLESAIRWVQEAAELGVHRLGHALALGVDPEAYGPHTRVESVAERRDQIRYDLRHAPGLRAAGVAVEASDLRRELAALAGLSDAAAVNIAYDSARLEQIRRRQDFAMACVRATGAVIEVCPTSNRRIGGVLEPTHHPIHRFLEAGLPVIVSSDDPGIFGITLAEELDWVIQHTGQGEVLRQRLIAASWNSRSEILSGRLTGA